MESVIREWNRHAATVSLAARPLASAQPISRPSLDIKRLVNFATLFQPTRLKEQSGNVSNQPVPLPPDQLDQRLPAPMMDAFELSSRSRSVPLNAIRRMNPNVANAASGKVTFEGLGSAESSPRTSFEGNSRLGSLDLAQPSDQIIESCCPPYATKSPLAVSTCHMLKFLNSSGPMIGRKESGVLRGRKYMSLASSLGKDLEPALAPSSRKQLLSAGNSLDSGFKLSLLDKQPASPRRASTNKGWVHDPTRSDSGSSAGIGSVSMQRSKAHSNHCNITCDFDTLTAVHCDIWQACSDAMFMYNIGLAFMTRKSESVPRSVTIDGLVRHSA